MIRKRSKYGNIQTTKNGKVFASKKQANDHQDLMLLEKAGEIKNLQHEVEFPVVVNGIDICSYFADHVFSERGKRIAADTKSPATRKNAVWRLKWKLVKALYKGWEFREI